MGILLPGLSIELLSIVILPSPCFFCKAIFLKMVKVVYFYRLVYVLILKDFGWQLSPVNFSLVCARVYARAGQAPPLQGFHSGLRAGLILMTSWAWVGGYLDDLGGLGGRGAVL